MLRLLVIIVYAFWMIDTACLRAQTKVDSPDHAFALPAGVDTSTAIDLAIARAWKQNKLAPANRCDDATFARRLYLDMIGRIPTAAELNQFIQNTDSRKREQLVDSLLQSSEYARHFAQVFDAIFLGRTDVSGLQRRSESGWTNYLEDIFAKNRPWNEVVDEILLARPSSKEARGAVWYLVSRNDKHQEMAEAISKDFFGVRIDCAQCHNHPLADEILQSHYWDWWLSLIEARNAIRHGAKA